jgi:NAD(P)-dependent dehydrogenase (short-subunit alcohol dehydrogenase family)/ribosomal protein S18 acetylase RimI-like enzyme
VSTLAGRVAVVTGAAAGIGLAVAEVLAREGAQLVLCDIDPEAGRAAAGRLGATFVAADARVEIELEQVFAVARERHGGVDLLVNNAGGREPPAYPDVPATNWTAVLDLNLRAPMLAAQLAIESMRQRGGGAIVNVASSAGVGLGPHAMPEYAAAKAGLIRLTGALAPLAAEGIRVSCVAPGMVDTPASRRSRARMTDAERARLPAILEAADVARLVCDLLADAGAAGRIVYWESRDEPPRVLAAGRPAPLVVRPREDDDPARGRPTPVDVCPLGDGERDWANAELQGAWGEGAARLGELVDFRALPGFVARIAGRPAGLVTYAIRGDACEVVTLNSLEPGRGVARALLDAVRAAATAAGCTRLWLITSNDNLRALRLYQRWGLELVALHRDAVNRSRATLKPGISERGEDGIPIAHELELELRLDRP